jgi:hypothetical protein
MPPMPDLPASVSAGQLSSDDMSQALNDSGDADAVASPASAAANGAEDARSANLRTRSTMTSSTAGKDLVIAGTLDAFIEKMLQDARATKMDYDYDFIDLFLVSHPCFVPSEEVLTRLVKQYVFSLLFYFIFLSFFKKKKKYFTFFFCSNILLILNPY